MTDMLSLRLALVGRYTSIMAFHMLHPWLLGIPLKWSAIVNIGAACYLIADQMLGTLSPNVEELYGEHFPMLARGQVEQILSLGIKRMDLPTDNI